MDTELAEISPEQRDQIEEAPPPEIALNPDLVVPAPTHRAAAAAGQAVRIELALLIPGHLIEPARRSD